MIPRRLATTAALCVLTVGNAWAQQMPSRPLPSSNTPQQGVTTPATNVPQQQTVDWSAEEIEAAQGALQGAAEGPRCRGSAGHAVARGTECGTPAPMKLISIGKSQQQVMLSPPVDLTCDMIAALHKWVQQDLQPLARKNLGGALVRIDAMSSYSCRNAYGRAKSRLSEHGRVNALDIGAFVTARGETARVVADWGMTAREIAAAAKAGETTTAQTKTAPATEPPKHTVTAGTPRAVDRPVAAETARAGIAIGIPGISIQMPAGFRRTPVRLDWYSPTASAAPSPRAAMQPRPSLNGKMDFLREAHHAACKIFGTVLGPEANSATKTTSTWIWPIARALPSANSRHLPCGWHPHNVT
jgi:hypothetical protein